MARCAQVLLIVTRETPQVFPPALRDARLRHLHVTAAG